MADIIRNVHLGFNILYQTSQGKELTNIFVFNYLLNIVTILNWYIIILIFIIITKLLLLFIVVVVFNAMIFKGLEKLLLVGRYIWR